MCVLARRNHQWGKSTDSSAFCSCGAREYITFLVGLQQVQPESSASVCVCTLYISVSHTTRSLAYAGEASGGKLKSALQMMFYWLREVAAAVVTFLIWPCSSIDIGRMLNSRRLLLVLWSYATRLETSLGLGLFFCSFFSLALSLALQLQSHQKILSLTGSNRSAE
jgi:hypothetical protein